MLRGARGRGEEIGRERERERVSERQVNGGYFADIAGKYLRHHITHSSLQKRCVFYLCKVHCIVSHSVVCPAVCCARLCPSPPILPWLSSPLHGYTSGTCNAKNNSDERRL